MIDRRAFLRGGALLGAGLLVRNAGLRAQGQGDSVADALRWPSAVQPRAVVQQGDDAELVKSIEQRLKCTCGCNLDIFTCRTTDFTCSYSPALHRDVMNLLAQGKSADEVIAAFVVEHGESILMAPEPEGFNLAGYLVPGLAVLTGAAALAIVLLRRERALVPAAVANPPAGAATEAAEPPPGVTQDELERLQRALDATAD